MPALGDGALRQAGRAGAGGEADGAEVAAGTDVDPLPGVGDDPVVAGPARDEVDPVGTGDVVVADGPEARSFPSPPVMSSLPPNP